LSEEELLRCFGDDLYQMEWWQGNGEYGGSRTAYTDRGDALPKEGLAAYYDDNQVVRNAGPDWAPKWRGGDYDEANEQLNDDDDDWGLLEKPYTLPCTKENPANEYYNWGSYDEGLYFRTSSGFLDEHALRGDLPCGMKSEWEEGGAGYLRSMGALACEREQATRCVSTLSCE